MRMLASAKEDIPRRIMYVAESVPGLPCYSQKETSLRGYLRCVDWKTVPVFYLLRRVCGMFWSVNWTVFYRDQATREERTKEKKKNKRKRKIAAR